MIARRLVGVAALLVVGCTDSGRQVAVDFYITRSDTELPGDTVYTARATSLPVIPCIDPPGCWAPGGYGLYVSGAIRAGTCDSLTASASDRRESGTHFVTLNLRTITSDIEACSDHVSLVYGATIGLFAPSSGFGFDDWILHVNHDGVPVPPYD